MSRVLIQTLDIRLGNYGSALQAFALQRAIASLGFLPTTALKRRKYRMFGVPVTATLYRWTNLILPRTLVRTRFVYERMNRPFEDFIRRNLRTQQISFPPEARDHRILQSFDAFIAGSDQIWRPPYADIPFYLFDYVTSPRAIRLSYAASFGRDDFTPAELATLAEAAPHAARFCAVSVRESSGIPLCRDQWSVDAVQLIDPTLLLAPEDYRGLVNQTGARENFTSTGIFEYILDADENTMAMANNIRTALNFAPGSTVAHPTENATESVVANRRKFVKPTIEQWLHNVDTASFIVTDSFHGCCFAILFNKPFIALGNAKRGQARFTSLLGAFGLESRLVSSPDQLTPDLIAAPIDWDRVNAILATERIRSQGFLQKNLSPVDVP